MDREKAEYDKRHRCKACPKDILVAFNYKNVTQTHDGWWLMYYDIDFDWQVEYYTSISKINYCPFCGKELK